MGGSRPPSPGSSSDEETFYDAPEYNGSTTFTASPALPASPSLAKTAAAKVADPASKQQVAPAEDQHVDKTGGRPSIGAIDIAPNQDGVATEPFPSPPSPAKPPLEQQGRKSSLTSFAAIEQRISNTFRISEKSRISDPGPRPKVSGSSRHGDEVQVVLPSGSDVESAYDPVTRSTRERAPVEEGPVDKSSNPISNMVHMISDKLDGGSESDSDDESGIVGKAKRTTLGWIDKMKRRVRTQSDESMPAGFSPAATVPFPSYNSSSVPSRSGVPHGAVEDHSLNWTAPEEVEAPVENVKYIKVHSSDGHRKQFSRLVRVQDLEGHTGPVWAVKFSSDGRYLVTAGQDMCVRVWCLSGDREGATAAPDSSGNIALPKAPEASTDSAVPGSRLKQPSPAPSRSTTPTGSRSSTPSKRNKMPMSAGPPVFDPHPLRSYHGHTGDILDVAISKNNFVLTSSMDKTVRLWHVTRDECLGIFQHTDFVSGVAFHPRDDRFFLSGSLDGKLRLWSIVEKRVQVYNELPGAAFITAVAITADGATSIAGTYLGACLFYDTDTLKYKTQVQVRSSRGKNSRGKKITGIQVIPGEDKILVSSNDSRLRAYHMNDKSLFCKFRGHENLCSQLHANVSNDGRYVISGSEDHRIYIWPWAQPSHGDTSGGGLFSGFFKGGRRGGLNEHFEAHSSSVTAAVFSPSETVNRIVDLDLRPPLPPHLLNTTTGTLIVSADYTGVIRVFENERPRDRNSSTPTDDRSSSHGSYSGWSADDDDDSGPDSAMRRSFSKKHHPSAGIPQVAIRDIPEGETCVNCGSTRIKTFGLLPDGTSGAGTGAGSGLYRACLECSMTWRI